MNGTANHWPSDGEPWNQGPWSVRPDCRHYRGDRPCRYNRLCRGCEHGQPFSHRICIIKLGALGDVIRTLGILPALKAKYPDSQITWVTLPNGQRMIQGHPLIDRVVGFDALSAMTLSQERFDLAIGLDKEPAPTSLMMMLQAQDKRGIGQSPFGTPVPLNTQALPYFALGLSDELKFHRNQQSYLALVHQAIGLEYPQQKYTLPDRAVQRLAVRRERMAQGWDPGCPTLGVNVGAGSAFANKMWPAEMIAQTIRRVRQEDSSIQVLLLGGPGERAIARDIQNHLAADGPESGPAWLRDCGFNADEPTFTAWVDACDVLFTGDTMAMHVAVALGKPVVAVFGPTCHQEIDLFGLGEKIVTSVPCAPCYKRHCDQGNACLKQADVQHAAQAILHWLPKPAAMPSIHLPLHPVPVRGVA